MSARYSDIGTHSKSVGAEANEAARNFVRDLIATDFDGVASRAALAFGVAQSSLVDFMLGRRGAGMKTLAGIARYAGVSLDVVLGRVPEESERHTPRALAMALAKSSYLPETTAQLRLYASFNAVLSPEEWKRLGDGYDRENRAAIDRRDLNALRARPLALAPRLTKRARS